MLFALESKRSGMVLRLLLAAIPWAFISVSCDSSSKPEEHYDIALYNDTGAWEESVIAMGRMFAWMGYSVKVIDADYINGESLNGFRALAMPGGSMYEYGRSISESGKEKVRAFVSQGHGYIGICGGANFAANETYWRGNKLQYSPLGLFDETSAGPSNDIVAYPEYGMCRLVMSDTLFSPDSEATRDEWILYYWGPVLRPNENAGVAVLGRYAVNSEAAIVAFSYGNGRVFLIGTHPEIEEDSDLDNVAFGDELDDHGSDWEFMKRATKWCLQQ